MGEITRRAALTGIGIGLATTAAACGGDAEDNGPSEGAPPAPTTNGGPPPPASTSQTDPPQPDPVLGPKELLAGVEHIVVLMMENRSFDHMLGALQTKPSCPNTRSSISTRRPHR